MRAAHLSARKGHVSRPCTDAPCTDARIRGAFSRCRVFESTTADYLEYVRGSEQYTSQLVECPFGYRPDVADAMEVSVFQPRE